MNRLFSDEDGKGLWSLGGREPPGSLFVAVKVATIYAIAGVLWILITDQLASAYAPDLRTFLRLQTLKGWIFVALSGLLIFLLVRRDVESIKRISQRKRESERRYRDLLASSSEAIVIVDGDSGTILEVNPKVEELTGYPPAELIGYSVTRIYPPEKKDEYGRELADIVQGGGVVGDRIVQHRDGHRIPVDVAASVVHTADDQTVVQETFRSIVERRRTEEKQAALIEREREARERAEEEARRAGFLAVANRVLGASLDYEPTIHNVARGGVPTLGDWCIVDLLTEQGGIRRAAVAPADPARESVAREIARHPPEPSKTGYVEQLFRTGGPVLQPDVSDSWLRAVARSAEHMRIVRDLNVRSVMVIPMIVRGRIIGALTYMTAESERRYDSEDLQLAEEYAHRAAMAIENARLHTECRKDKDEKVDFLVTTARELHPRAKAVEDLVSRIEAEAAGQLKPARRRQLEYAENDARRLLDTVDELLSYASAESRRKTVRPVRTRLSQIMREAVAIVEPVAAAKGIEFRADIPEERLIVETDPSIIHEVLIDLLTSLVRVTDEGTIALEARVEDETVRFVVADTGLALTPENRNRIFDPFWQLHHAGEPGVGGMGLSSVRHLTQLLGGDVMMETPVEGQTSIIVSIPLESTGVAGDQPRTGGSVELLERDEHVARG